MGDTNAPEHIVEVSHLNYGYSEETVLHDISLTIDRPGLVSIIGPNGVGKSTLVKCLNGIIKPTNGTVKIMGKDINEYKLKELAKIVGYVPVATEDYLTMSVLDTVLVGRYAHQKWRTSEADIRIAHKALQTMDMDQYSMRNFNELSAGQHQKVSIARGLVQEPKILILDEPTSNLDIRHQIFVSAFLKSLAAKTGMVVLMISHDINLAAKYSDEIIVMKGPGVIHGIGTPQEMMTEDMIKDVYGVGCTVVEDHGMPHIILQSVLPVDVLNPEDSEKTA